MRRQRILFLIALAAGVAAFTGVMLVLGRALAERFAKEVQADLEWRAVRGARELSMTTELDRALINEALGAYAASPDVHAIAVEVGDQRASSNGTIAAIAPVFAAPPGTLVRGADYVASWAAALADGAAVGKIAVVMSTRRLADARAMQQRLLHLTLIAGGAAAILGAAVILWLTRGARTAEPAALPVALGQPAAAAPVADDTAPLTERIEELTDELEERQRGLRLVLEHAAQGFLAVELGGRMTRDRSVAAEAWFGPTPTDTTLADYLRPYDDAAATQLASSLAQFCEGVLSIEDCLAQLPKRLTAGGTTLDVRYVPMLRDERPERILGILTDVTEQVARERAELIERERRELAGLARLITEDRASFDEFFAEAAGLVGSLDTPADPEAERRTMRTLKDNCAYYGLETFVAQCEAIETDITDNECALNDAQRAEVAAGWAKLAGQLAGLLA